MFLLYPPFHPIAAFALIAVLIGLWIFPRLIYLLKITDLRKVEFMRLLSFTSCTLLSVWLIIWISSFGIWSSTIKNIADLINEGGTTNLELVSNKVAYGQSFGYSAFWQFIKQFGGCTVCLSTVIMSLPLIVQRRKNEEDAFRLFNLYGAIVILLVLLVLFFAMNLSFGPLRMLPYLIIISVIYSGYALNNVIKLNNCRSYKNSLAIVLIIILLLSICTNGILTLYPSRYTLSANLQTTEASVYAMDWFFNNMNLAMDIMGVSIAPGRYAEYLLTSNERLNYSEIPLYLQQNDTVYHFGYDTHVTIGELSRSKDAYLLITQRDKILYSAIFPEMAKYKWYPWEFLKLEYDSAADKIYSNNGFDLYYLRFNRYGYNL
jgi:hypothetical protein